MLILSPGISSSELSTYLLPCSALALGTPWSSCTTYVVLALVSVLIWALILLAGGSSLDEPSMLFLCLNISGSVWIKPLRPDVNAGDILSSFYSCFYICSNSFFCSNSCYIFLIWHDENKAYAENKNKMLPSRWAFIHVACRVKFSRITLSHIGCSP